MKYLNYFIAFLFITNLIASLNNNDTLNYKNPQISWRLAIIPGLGQIYNEEYFKSFSFITLQIYSGYKYIQLNNENNYSMRNTYAWWTFGLYIWSMLDAYVDAHLSSFPVNKSNQSNEEFTE
tara:strand:+ start:5340 stop:5705 length:366 start_codon:yes stop_codon:yes gene_type:complete